MRILSALALCVALGPPVWAGDTFETPITGEILPGWRQADGTHVAAIKLELAPGWKTYWRTPGDAGIPPQFDWSGSDNLKGARVTWPTPAVFLTSGMRTIGYSGQVILPIALAPRRAGKAISVKVALDIGVCSDICVPHQMSLQATLDGTATAPTPAIAAALAERPLSGKEAGVTSATCALQPTADGMGIRVSLRMPSAGGNEVVIVEPGQTGLWVSEALASRQGGTLSAEAEILSGSGPVAVERSGIRITVLGRKHAVDIKGCNAP